MEQKANIEAKAKEISEDNIYKDYFEHQRKYAIKQMFIRDNIGYDLKSDYNIFYRYFYWLKAFICLKLNKFNHKGFGIHVITYDEYNCPDSTNWQYVSVGEGMFTNWGIEIGSDGT